MHKEGVKEKANELLCRLRDAGLRVKADFSDYSPGWKFAEYEMKGIPLRVEIGPKDIENGQCIAVRRDNGEKVVLSLAELEEKVKELLDSVQQGLFDKAKRNLVENTFDASTADEIKEIIETRRLYPHEVVRSHRMRAQAQGVCRSDLKMYSAGAGRKNGSLPRLRKTSDTTIIWGVAY